MNERLMHWAPLGCLTTFCLCLAAVGLGVPSVAADEPAVASDLLSALTTDRPLFFCGEEIPVQRREVRERFEKEMLLSLWDRPQALLWLKRSHRYLPHIEKILAENGLPDDLKFIAVAESALRPHSGSRKGAVGFWQFTADTARTYGLVVDPYVDQRRNIFASTDAAAQYFKKLYRDFESWTLAAAAYNMGEGGLAAEIMEQGTRDYYRLYLPIETQRYLLRIASVKLILSEPERYGFKLAKKDYYPPLSFDRIQVDCPREVPIRLIAQAAGTHFKTIKDLNPEFRGHYLAQGQHSLLIPEGAAPDFQARFQTLVEKFASSRKERIYVVQDGDNLSTISERFGVPLAALIIWNRIDLDQPIHPGDRLVILPDTTP